MIINFLQKNKFTRKVINWTSQTRSLGFVKLIEPFLTKNSSIIDIGAGTCHVCKILRSKNYSVTPIDIVNLSFVDNLKPIIYDGKKIPFPKNKFDLAIISTVLHHTKDHKIIINEAKRVAKRILIIEDIYDNIVQKYITFAWDCLSNLEFKNHPHSNRNDKEWKIFFKKMGLKLIKSENRPLSVFLKLGIYLLEKTDS